MVSIKQKQICVFIFGLNCIFAESSFSQIKDPIEDCARYQVGHHRIYDVPPGALEKVSTWSCPDYSCWFQIRDDEAEISDFKTGKTKKLSFKDISKDCKGKADYRVSLTSDARYFSVSCRSNDNKQSLWLLDRVTDETKILRLGNVKTSYFVDGFYYSEDKKKVYSIDTQLNKRVELPLSYGPRETFGSPIMFGNKSVVYGAVRESANRDEPDQYVIKKKDLKTGKVISENLGNFSDDWQFKNADCQMLGEYSPTKEIIKIRRFVGDKLSTVEIPAKRKQESPPILLSNCKEVIISQRNEKRYFDYFKINIETGEETLFVSERGYNNCDFAKSGRNVSCRDDKNGDFFLDFRTNENKKSLDGHNEYENFRIWYSRVSEDGKFLYQPGVPGESTKIRVLSLQDVCVNDRHKVEFGVDIPVCLQRPTSEAAQGAGEQSASKVFDIGLEALCALPYQESDWTPVTDQTKCDQIPLKTALYFLKRFQKPGGFRAAKDLSVLLAILRSKIIDDYPEEVGLAMQGVLHDSNVLYQKLQSEFPRLRSVKLSQSTKACRTEKEEAELSTSANDYLEYLLRSLPKKTELKDWPLQSLGNLLSKIDQAKKDSLMDRIAQSVADKAADSEAFHDIFLSKLYKFALKAVKSMFGETAEVLSDLTLVRKADRLIPVILSTHSIDGDSKTETPFGFYGKSIAPIKLEKYAKQNKKVTDQTISWTVNGTTLSAKLDITYASTRRTMIPSGRSPDYASLWNNGLVGIIVTGTNLKDLSAGVLDEYLHYYMDQGFKFEDETLSTANLPEFLKSIVESGEADYLIKEAHSDGDEKNLFRLDKSANYKIGNKTYSDGRKEKVYLIFPKSDETKTTLLANEEFGEWIRQREKTGNGQFVYFNTSCWSATKAVHEIEATKSRLLLNIPSTTTVIAFENEKTNAEFQLLSAFRGKKSFEQMRTALTQNPEYKSGKENGFIFPDEYAYERAITSVLEIPLTIKPIQVKDASGKIYNIDAAE